MNELEKLLNSLSVLKSIEILNNLLINLYRRKRKIEDEDCKIYSDQILMKIDAKIYFFETTRENLFYQIKIIQRDTPSGSVPLYSTSYRVFCSTS